jgi:hypothetical protein
MGKARSNASEERLYINQGGVITERVSFYLRLVSLLGVMGSPGRGLGQGEF